MNEREPRSRDGDPFGFDASDLLPETGADERDTGWGESSAGGDRDDLRRFLDEKPPHHL